MPEPDLVEIFAAPLHQSGARHLVAGSVGAMVYSEPRLTIDIDLTPLRRRPEAGIRFAGAKFKTYGMPMSTITAVLEPDAEGYLHLAAPAELRSSKVRIVATLEAVDAARPQAGSKLKALLSSGRTLDQATATARIAEVYQDREAWRSQ